MFVAHTPEQKEEMLKTIGVKNADALLESLPQKLLNPAMDLPNPMTEMELVRHVRTLAAKDRLALSFLGAGAYEHFIPASVWALALRGEFATAYTPYQAEASQGTLQSIFEFQTMVSELYGLPVANASMYDGASAAAEACLLALRHTNRTEILIPDTVHPLTRQVIQTYLAHSGTLRVLSTEGGTVSAVDVQKQLSSNTAAVLLQNPNFFGCIEANAKAIGEAAHQAGALFVMSSYPTALGMIQSPGECGADIAVGEGQPLGLPLGYGGPYLGLMACQPALMRKMPGRIVGQTSDTEGRRAYVLTLQAREQHIRREKATSNICSNEALCALASSIYLSLIGKNGFKALAELNYHKAHAAKTALAAKGFKPVFDKPFFNEFVVKCPVKPETLVDRLAEDRVLAGLPLGPYFPERQDELLVCVTEIKTKTDIDHYAGLMAEAAR